MLWESVTDSCDVYQCTRLFKNVFKIRGTPESAVAARSRGRRIMNMASQRLSSPEPLSLLINKENDSASPSPLKMFNGKLLKSPRLPLEDCNLNSHDSGYSTMSNGNSNKRSLNTPRLKNDTFQFAEPFGVAPRRISLDSHSNSPLSHHHHHHNHQQYSSPISSYYSSPSIPKRSSGYGSMDDGFNELVDTEIIENNQPRTLPNGITDLISGEIVTQTYEKPMECDGATTPEFSRIRTNRVRRSLSMQIDRDNDNDDDTINTSSISKVRSCLFRSPNATSSAGKLSFNENNSLSSPPFTINEGVRKKIFTSPNNYSLNEIKSSFKRPEPPTDDSPILVKRSRKTVSFRTLPENSSLTFSPPQSFKLSPSSSSCSPTCSRSEVPMDIVEKINDCTNKPPLNRCLSESDAHEIIKSAINRSTTDSHLTGDFSKTCILPLAEGRHEDLKSITSETLAKLIHGEYNYCIDEFKIVDCRYPYEYEAGHINGAINLYTKDLIEEFLLSGPLNKMAIIEPDDKKRNILIFHCEFSWERGPNLSRYLRNIDRKLNKESYPALHYPEIYLLHGGYQQFYRLQKNLCTPQGYRPMTHPDHEADLRKFRSKSKSWQGEKPRPNNGCPASRASLRRLGF